MRGLIALLSAFIILASCAGEPKSELQSLKAAFEADNNTTTYQALMEGVIGVIQDSTSDDASVKEALQMGYDASLQIDSKPQAIGFLNSFVKDYPADEGTPDRLFELGTLLNQLGKTEAGNTILQGFVNAYPDHEKTAAAQEALPESFDDINTRLEAIGESMFDVQAGSLNKEMARNFVDVCEAFALTHPNDPQSADLLHKAAETARAMRTIPKALSLYDWILEDYPDHEKASQALFLKAFTYDNNLGDVENARKYYQAFLEKYPEDDFADDTQFLLENLGKSDEEILEALTKKTQK